MSVIAKMPIGYLEKRVTYLKGKIKLLSSKRVTERFVKSDIENSVKNIQFIIKCYEQAILLLKKSPLRRLENLEKQSGGQN